MIHKFIVGQQVRVINPDSSFFGQVGAVDSITYKGYYRVVIPSEPGKNLLFMFTELEAAYTL